jgi:hypothetical protein
VINQADVVEHLEVLRYRGLTEADCCNDVADGTFAGGQVKEDVAPTGFGDSVKTSEVVAALGMGKIIFRYGICCQQLSSNVR